MTKLATITKKDSNSELTQINVVTTGEPSIVEMKIKNTSDRVLRNPVLEMPSGVKLLSPKKFPTSMIPDQSFNAKIEIDGMISFNGKIRFVYDFVKTEEL